MLDGSISKDRAVVSFIVNFAGIRRCDSDDELAEKSKGIFFCGNLVQTEICHYVSTFSFHKVSFVAGDDATGVASWYEWTGIAPSSSIDFSLDPFLVFEVDDEVYLVAVTSMTAAVIGFAVVDITILVIGLGLSEEKKGKEGDELDWHYLIIIAYKMLLGYIENKIS